MKIKEIDLVPDDHDSKQCYVSYQLTKADIIRLYVFMSPEEINKTFGKDHCCSVATMYNIVRAYGMRSRKKCDEVLKQCLLRYCPHEEDVSKFEQFLDAHIAMAKAHLIAEIQGKVVSQGRLWGDE
jgi:hypothetical protein